ncbi:MAG: hypothetical protein R6U37_01260 [Dehalococcoidia bacterium]
MKSCFLILMVIMLVLPALAACGGDGGETADTPEPNQTATGEPIPTQEPAQTTIPASPAPTETQTPVEEGTFSFYRNPDFPAGYSNPIEHLPIPQNPFLRPRGQSNMHCDSYMTDTYEVSGPLGVNPDVFLKKYNDSINMCVTLTFDSQGRMVLFNARFTQFLILLVDPDTLEELAAYQLPRRDSGDLPTHQDTSGGAYFVLDSRDRALVADSENVLQVIKYNDAKGEFELLERYDLSDYMVPRVPPSRDHLQMAIPDWDGLLWFASRYGKVGTINEETGEIKIIELEGEEMQNSFTVGEDGVYIVTDHAMYRFSADESGLPVIDWRTEYDRGTQIKPGLINQGCGTTPTLIGDMVVIADNAEPRMNILFLQRSDGKVVCQTPVFEDGLSTTENALIGVAREGKSGTEYSIIVENNYGVLRENMFAPMGCCETSVGGVTRVDLIPDGKGGYTCGEVWRSPENSCSTVPKLSLGNGLVYLYTYEPFVPVGQDNFGWYLTAVDFETGKTVYRIPTGKGGEYHDYGAPITLAPQEGVAYIGCLGGLIRIQDGAE